MDDAALFALAKGTATHGLSRVRHLLDVIAGHDRRDTLLEVSLANGMFSCAEQLQTAIGFCERCVYPVAGRPVPEHPEGQIDLEGLVDFANSSELGLRKVTQSQFDGATARKITHQAGQAGLEQTSAAYLIDFAIPNLWIHVSIAYACLRKMGVPVGKADFDGLHSYPAGFRFSCSANRRVFAKSAEKSACFSHFCRIIGTRGRMTFDPVIATQRFGMGLSPRFGRPESVDALLGDLSGADDLAEVFPIPVFDAATPSLTDFADAFRERNQTRGTAAFAAVEAKLKTLRIRVRQAQYDHARATLARAVDAPIGFRERLVAFWADHFTVKARQGHSRHLVSCYIEEAIRPHVGGRFVDLLTAAETHPMMLRYLEQIRSVGPHSPFGLQRGRGLNENLAREMLELHTLGVGGGYTQTDVRELAELLTGMTYSPAHGRRYLVEQAEPGAETVLGVTYPASSDQKVIHQALADLAAHSATATHLARKLATHFVADDPDPDLIDAVADAYRAADGDLSACYRAMFDHPLSWRPKKEKVRPPVDYIVGCLRALGITGADVAGADNDRLRKVVERPLQVMGQPWQNPPGPDGWADRAEDWIIPQTLAGRMSWAMRIPAQLRDPLPDPREVVTWALGPDPDPAVAFAAEAAETRADGIATIFASAAFNRR